MSLPDFRSRAAISPQEKPRSTEGTGTAMIVFIVLAYAIAWLPWWYTLVTGEPLRGLFSFGPLIAALLTGLLLRRTLRPIEVVRGMLRWRVGVRAYIAAVLWPIGVLAISLLVHCALGGQVLPQRIAGGLASAVATLPLMFVLGGPLGEEPGWRGFLLPLLAQKCGSRSVASVWVGVVWALWHLPLFFAHKMPPPAAIAMIFGSITFAWLYYEARGSTFVTALCHAIGNAFGGAFFFSLIPADQFGQLVTVRIALEIGLGIVCFRLLRAASPAAAHRA